MTRSIRISAVAFMLTIAGAALLRAQSDYSSSKATNYLTIGPSFSAGASMIFSPPQGSKVVPQFAYRAAADATYPLSPSVGVALGLGFEGKAFRLRSPDASDVYDNTNLNYFSITPGFRFSAFYIGMEFALPMSASTTSKRGTVESTASFTQAEFDKLNVLAQPKIGAVVEIMNNDNGWLGLTIMGTVSIAEVADRGDVTADAAGDFHLTSGQLGLTYQFAIPGTKH